ncbi:hypothetical protein ACFFKU_14810 [Kineococcus gynurae]|uniref:Uncharacterized protein n=1 Tax=Kineococcus gynurae TaxID=452979 RepID=A0ABV5LTP1_9ACTN
MTRHDDGTDGADPQLRARLRATDPARDLPALDPAWTTWKVRQTMDTTESTTPTTSSATDPARAPRPRRRVPVPVLVGAGALAVAAVAVTAVTLGSPRTTVTALSLPPAGDALSAMCAVISPEGLAQHETAFAGRVEAVADGRVTLAVTERFKGEVGDEVTVPQPAADLPAEVSPGTFETGRTYLISSDGGVVAACGQSGADSPELRALYRQAFPG